MTKRTTQVIAAVIGVVIFAVGIYLSFFETKGFLTTTAVVDRIEETWNGTDADGVNDYDYDVWVSYSINGRTHQGELDTYNSSYQEGKRIKIYYDPENPERIHGDSRKFGMILWVAGPIVTAVAVVAMVKDGKETVTSEK